MKSHRAKGRRCSFESLENRRLLAGNVTATIDTNGNLIVKGDRSDNQIAISVAGTTVTITSATTTVNSTAAAGGVPITGTFDGNGRIEINLKKGTDSVTLTGPLTMKGLESEHTETVINTGTLTVNGKMEVEDVSTLTLTTTTVNGNMEAEGTKGVDNFNLTDVTVTGKSEIETHKGKDVVTIQGTKAAGASSFDTLNVKLGKNDDTLNIKNTTVTTKTVLNGGRGTADTYNDQLGNSLSPANFKKKHFELP